MADLPRPALEALYRETAEALRAAEEAFLRARGWVPWAPIGLEVKSFWTHPSVQEAHGGEAVGVPRETAIAWEFYPAARPPGVELVGEFLTPPR